MKRRSILALAILPGAAFALLAASAVIWRHDPMDAARMATPQRSDSARSSKATGPLRRHVSNPRYFTDGSGKAIYLTGSHTWSNSILDVGLAGDLPTTFDFNGYLNFLTAHNHNFIRLWTWDHTHASCASMLGVVSTQAPYPYPRTGPGNAHDGGLKFDLSQFNQDYFDRLRTRIIAASNRGIYVSIMLFEGDGSQFCNTGDHPFTSGNNINGVDGGAAGLTCYNGSNNNIVKIQHAYISKVIDTVNDLDNVLYEIANEASGVSTAWQYGLIDYIHSYESTKPLQHPVGMTFQWQGGGDAALYASNADWISPNSALEADRNGPPTADGRKVILLDTDHIWGVGGDRGWVWKSFTRGLNPIYMDPFEREECKSSWAKFQSCRRAMGDTLAYANRMNLAKATPRGDLASTGYCLANPGEEYLVLRTIQGPRRFLVPLLFRATQSNQKVPLAV